MSKIIEIRGTDFVNKGAELMCQSIIANLKSPDSDLKFVMAPGWDRDYRKRCEYGLYQKIHFKVLGKQISPMGKFFPKKLKKYYGLISEDEIDLVLDASGFSYSDQWGTRSIDDLHSQIGRLRKCGTELVFMPQAFGPFEDQSSNDKMKEIFDYASMVFCRDYFSLEHIQSLVTDQKKLQLMPDFTMTTQWTEGTAYDQSGPVTFVPNSRMLDKQSKELGESYLRLMSKAIETCSDTHQVRVMPFESMDLALAKELADKASIRPQVCFSENPLELKRIIAHSSLLIGSRFHAIVSSLSQGVPAIGLGWSHKYLALFKDFEIPDYCLNLEDGINPALKKISEVTTASDTLPEISNLIRRRSNEFKEMTSTMWSQIQDILQIKS